MAKYVGRLAKKRKERLANITLKKLAFQQTYLVAFLGHNDATETT